jgi:BlaI family penicillinase repressor
MARTSQAQPTDGELNILKILWQRGPSRLSEICGTFARERRVAPTTIATMLKIMEGKGQVKRVTSQEGVVWEAVLTQTAAGNHLLRNLINRVFEGSAQKLVLHLLEKGNLSETDQREIRRLLVSKSEKT